MAAGPIILIVGGFVIVVGLLWWLSPKHVIGLTPTSLIIPLNSSATFSVQLMYKPWFRKFKPISGTITSTAPPSIVIVSPVSIATTSAGGRKATITVTGVVEGNGKVIVNGTSRKGSHDSAEVSVKVN